MLVPECQASEASATVAAPFGAAVGPNWVTSLLAGTPAGGGGRLRLELQSTLKALHSGSQGWPLRAMLSTGLALDVDCVISATGVEPSVGWVPIAWARGADGGLLVDQRCAVVGAPPGVYAAGDAACCAGLEQPHWHQMRLWSQARALGGLAGTAMAEEGKAGDALADDASVDLFAHSTRFLGLRVVLLGRYNGQGLEAEAQHLVSYSHATPPGPKGLGAEFVRVLLLRGRVRGVVLIGDDACNLADTFERLILCAHACNVSSCPLASCPLQERERRGVSGPAHCGPRPGFGRCLFRSQLCQLSRILRRLLRLRLRDERRNTYSQCSTM